MIDRFLASFINQSPWLTLRFLFVGAFNTGLGFGVYSLLIYQGLSYPVAGLLTLIASILWSYTTMGKVVFQTRLKGKFIRYIIVWFLLYLINISFISIGIRFGLNAYWAWLVAMPLLIILAFFLQKHFVFRSTSS